MNHETAEWIQDNTPELAMECDCASDIDGVTWKAVEDTFPDAEWHDHKSIHEQLSQAVTGYMEESSRACLEEGRDQFLKDKIDEDEMELILDNYAQYCERPGDHLPSVLELKRERGDRICDSCHGDGEWELDYDLYAITHLCQQCYEEKENSE